MSARGLTAAVRPGQFAGSANISKAGAPEPVVMGELNMRVSWP